MSRTRPGPAPQPRLWSPASAGPRRDGLVGGGNRIRTTGTAGGVQLSSWRRFAFASNFALPGNQAEARLAPLETQVLSRGTDGSNPASSSEESANHQFLSGGAHHCGRLKCRRVLRRRFALLAMPSLTPLFNEQQDDRERRDCRPPAGAPKILYNLGASGMR